jgi:hypothetical protein
MRVEKRRMVIRHFCALLLQAGAPLRNCAQSLQALSAISRCYHSCASLFLGRRVTEIRCASPLMNNCLPILVFPLPAHVEVHEAVLAAIEAALEAEGAEAALLHDLTLAALLCTVRARDRLGGRLWLWLWVGRRRQRGQQVRLEHTHQGGVLIILQLLRQQLLLTLGAHFAT